MGNAYIHRVIRDKPDVDSVLEKEEPIGVGIDFQAPPVVSAQSSVRPPKVIFYYNGSSNELTVRTLAGSEVKLIADGFDNIQGVNNIAVDRTNHVVFFSLGDFEEDPWTSAGFYRFNYDEDSGEVIGDIELIYTGQAGIVTGILVDEENQKVYWGDYGPGGLIRSDYDLTNQETIITAGGFQGLYLDKDNDILYATLSTIINKYDISSLPASPVLWFREDDPSFGVSTWYKWGHMSVSPTLGTMFIGTNWPSLRYIDWPIAPATPTSYPPAYSRELAQKTGVLWFAWDYDERNQLMYFHNNASQITYRYDVSNLLMENETIMENLSSHPDYSFAHIDIMRLG